MSDDERDFMRGLFEDLRKTGGFGISIVSNPHQIINDLRPHYSNTRFRHAQTVYLAAGYQTKQTQFDGDVEYVKGAEYAYSDRIRQWDWNKAEAARKTAIEQVREDRCAAHIEVYLREFYGDPELKLVHILAGVNLSSGYDYQVYGWIPGKKTITDE